MICNHFLYSSSNILNESCSDDPNILIPCKFDIPSEDGERIQIICNPTNQGTESTNEDLSGSNSATQFPKPYYINCAPAQCKVNLIDTPGIGDTR